MSIQNKQTQTLLKERTSQLGSGKRDFHSVLPSFSVMRIASPFLGCVAALLFMFKFAMTFTNSHASGNPYHDRLKGLAILAFHSDLSTFAKITDAAVEDAYDRYKWSFVEATSDDSSMTELSFLKEIGEDIMNDISVNWIFNLSILGLKIDGSQKRLLEELTELVSEFNGLAGDVGVFAVLHGLFAAGVKDFTTDLVGFMYGRGQLFNLALKLGELSVNTFYGRAQFAFRILSPRVDVLDAYLNASPKDKTTIKKTNPLVLRMQALGYLTALILGWAERIPVKKPSEAKEDNSPFLVTFKAHIYDKFRHLTEGEKNQLLASNLVFILAAVQQATRDEYLILYESLYGDSTSEKSKQNQERFYSMIREKLSNSKPSLESLIDIATRLGDFLKDKTAVQTVDRLHPHNARVRLAREEMNAPTPAPFAISKGDTNSCAGKALAVYVLARIFLKFESAFGELSRVKRTRVASSSKLNDSSFRVTNIVEVDKGN